MNHPFCTEAVTTKRNEALGGGITGNPIPYLSGLLATPLWPVTPQTIESAAISSPREAKECFLVPEDGETLPDIVEGDVLVHGGADLTIEYVAEWPDITEGIPCLHVVVAVIKTTWPTLVAP